MTNAYNCPRCHQAICTCGPARRPIEVRLHDASVNIWQDDPNDPSFRTDVFAPLLRGFSRRGWKVRADPGVLKRHRILSPSHRVAARGDMRATIEIMGRSITVQFWAETWPIENTNGRKYDFNKLKRMVYLDRLRVRLETQRILTWLRTLAPITVKESDVAQLTPLQRIERDYAESWHTDKALRRPCWRDDRNRRSRDGGLIEQGSTVWFTSRSGRMCRGTAYYKLNSMWWVVAGGELVNLSCGEIFCQPPADLRTKRNDRRRARLEAELSAAVRRMDFKRAEALKAILFGAETTYMIWARDQSAYYRPAYAGYTTDTIAAGRYTRPEAEREVRRVPHELEAIGSNGERIRFDRQPAGAVANAVR